MRPSPGAATGDGQSDSEKSGPSGRPDVSAGGDARAPKLVCFSASALAHERERYLDAGFDDFIGKPFRYEQIVECLARLLKVTFDAVEAAGEPPADGGQSPMELPAELLLRLREAAERASATRLAQACAEMETKGGPYRALAARLAALGQAGDFDGILSALQTLREG